MMIDKAWRMTLVCAGMLGVLPVIPAQARGFCSEPLEPYCVASGLASAGGQSPAILLDCRIQLQRHLKQLIRYRTCLTDQAAETTGLIRERRQLLDCATNPELCVGLEMP
ncbi:MAG: hypothetical protein GC191_03580 [Azospirillum sp.]|nr:hypothetical protein [Azospirillum sp.]